MKQKDIRPAPSLIEYKNMRFLITDRPSDVTIQGYLQVTEESIGTEYSDLKESQEVTFINNNTEIVRK